MMGKNGKGPSVKLGRISAKELSIKTWKDFEELFARHNGVWGGCWCMYYHVARGWRKRTSKQNRDDKKELVAKGNAHGLIIYNDSDPIGWCQYGPPEELPRVENSRSFKPSQDSWRITCFFVDKRYRGKGVMRLLLNHVLKFMKKHGIRSVEAYPIETGNGKYRSAFLWPGTADLFTDAGFSVVMKTGKSTLVVQKKL